jgi:hypothetical protein
MQPPVVDRPAPRCRSTTGVRSVGTTRWNLTADVLGGDGLTMGKIYGDVGGGVGWGLGITVRLKAGTATELVMPQSLLRLGWLGTVRGFDTARIERRHSGRRSWISTPLGDGCGGSSWTPVKAARISRLFASSGLIRGRVGLSLFSGLIRFDLSRPISPDQPGKVRFDLVVQGVR